MTPSVTIRLGQVSVPPGQMIQIRDLSWTEFEALLTERGERGLGRIRYCDGLLTIMSPSPDHEFSKAIIGDLVKVILQETGTPALPLGSTTLQGMPVGIEPDGCYYIESAEVIRAVMRSGRNRIDLQMDPPPDLVLEIDVMSLTDVQLYRPLQVPEVWIYRLTRRQLDIYGLEQGDYVQRERSRCLSQIDVKQVIPEWLERARQEDPMGLELQFRQWVRQQVTERG